MGTAVLALVAGLLIVTHQSGGSSNTAIKEVALQTPVDSGDAPFTESVATETGPAESAPASAASKASSGATGIHSVQGTATGLYGGEMKKPACDVERLITQTASGDKGKAWASAEGIEQSAIPAYLRSLTSVVLRADTRVTNHNYQNGSAIGYQAVLQAGTAVLVDSQGVPRVRCACGNPLTPPVLASGGVTYTGKGWSSFQPSSLVVVTPAPAPVTQIVLVNVTTGTWFARETGHATTADKPVPAPKEPLAPGVPGTSPTASSSASSSASTSSSASSHPPTGTPSTGTPSAGSSSASSSASSHPATGTPSTGSPATGSTSSATKSSPPVTLSPSASEASTATTTATAAATATAANSATSTGSAGATSTSTSELDSAEPPDPASPPPALLPASADA
ncbi:hypothetical protein OG689_35950 [Kitasatospora sp. NBC_00240]|uniref:DUF6777 domain-containing protein n=1 Tax=Kitasatospora sp. NBC_00240 TaxID=2903567 RepID=UPI0022501955|nr:DUF6777 domain-containing protein [Kitasatospora sp. NBC_00240]MCX5214589.1 hypothetical protein [Kitasatospora sp. NBC_00240]